MTSGSSTGRAGSGSGSRSFDFGTDDVLCSYDDYAPQEASNGGKRSDPSKDFHESRSGRPLVNVYGQQLQEVYPKEEVISAVEKCMKKYADNLLLFLEGISGRLSQLELYCYKLERSIGDLRSDMVRDQTDKDVQLKSLEKHLQEVHRSVQILRDKQELADTQKELAKLQLAQKEPTTSHKSVEGSAPSVPEPKRHDEATPDIPNQQLALVPHQMPPPPLPAIPSEQTQTYKEPPPMQQQQQQQQAPPSAAMPQDRYLLNQPTSFYAPPQFQEQSFPQYQQQWSQPPPQQFPQQAVQPQQPPPLQQTRPHTPPTYPSYPPPHQPTSQPMQVHYSTNPQPRPEAISFGYGAPGGAASQRQQPPQGSQGSAGPPLTKSGYVGPVSYPPQPNLQGYSTAYSSMDAGRIAPSQNFQPGSYPPSNIPPTLQSQHHSQQPMRDTSYGEMVERAVSMGYQRDHVVGVIRGMVESGRPFDFNALLDRLNAPVVGASQRGWSG